MNHPDSRLHRFILNSTRRNILICTIAIIACLLRIVPLLTAPHDTLEYDALHFETYIGNDTIEHKLPAIPLRRGVYLVSVSYNAAEDTLLELGDVDSYTSHYIRGNSITLSYAETANTFRIYVDTGEISAIMRMYESGLTSRFSANQVTFYYHAAMSVVYTALCTLFPFVLLAAAFPLIRFLREKCDREQQLSVFALFILWVMISVPLMLDGIPHGHDTDAHILRVANLAEGLLQGMFPVRIQPGWYHDYGLPFGVCYPDLLLYVPAALYLIGLPLWRAYQIYRLFINAVAVLSAYFCFREITKSRQDGFLACVIYISSVRFLVNNHVRDASGETLSMVFLPLIALAFVLLARSERTRAFVCFVCGFTGVIQSHVITTRSVFVFCVLTFLFGIRVFLSRKNLLTVFASAITTLLVNAGFLVPFLHYVFSYRFKNPDYGNSFLKSGVTIGELLFYSTRVVPYALGGVFLAILFVLVFALVTKPEIPWNTKGIRVALAVTLLSVWMSEASFPYDTIFAIAPFMESVIGSAMQFKSRYLTVAAVSWSTLAALMLKEVSVSDAFTGVRKHRRAVFLVLLAFSALQIIRVEKDFTDSAYLIKAVDRSGCAFRDEPLYVFEDAYESETWDRNAHFPEKEVDVIHAERDGFRFTIDLKNLADEATFVDLPVWNYSSYRAVAAETGEQLQVTFGDNRRVRVSIPPGFSGEIDVAYTEPWFWRVAEIVSVVSAAAFLYVSMRRMAMYHFYSLLSSFIII